MFPTVRRMAQMLLLTIPNSAPCGAHVRVKLFLTVRRVVRMRASGPAVTCGAAEGWGWSRGPPPSQDWTKAGAGGELRLLHQQPGGPGRHHRPATHTDRSSPPVFHNVWNGSGSADPYLSLMYPDPRICTSYFRIRIRGSVSLTNGSGSADPYLSLTDPDADPDPALLVSYLQYAKKK